jgi:hypothetical protein
VGEEVGQPLGFILDCPDRQRALFVVEVVSVFAQMMGVALYYGQRTS